MAKRRKKKNREEEGVDESWLLPYADLMTLLLALFIVLFASSTIDETKLEQMSAVFSEIFDSGQGIMENMSPTDVPISDNKDPDNMDPNMDSAYLEDQQSLGEIQNRVDEYIAVHELENQFETQLTDEGLLVTIRDSILFAPGEANVKEEYLVIADELVDLLAFDPPRHIVVTGHTDNIPISSREYQDNWELSMMRAVNFLRIVVKNEEMDPLLFSAKGYGEYQPIDTNDTVEGRSKNRRVEILIQPLVLKDGSIFDMNQ